MKKSVYIIALSFITANLFGQFCPDGSFEQGNLSAFDCYSANLVSGNFGSYSLGCSLTNQRINPWNAVEGTNALRLGDSFSGQLSRIDYTYIATTNDLKFYYNVFFEDPSHIPSEQPYFEITITSSTAGLIDQQRITSGNSPLLEQLAGTANPPVLTTNWICYSKDLSPYMGQTITLSLVSADCGLGGHWGVAYIDGICSSDPLTAAFNLDDDFCYNESIIANGNASSYEQSHKWSLTHTDESGVPLGNTLHSLQPDKQVDQFNIKNFYNLKMGVDIPCNSYYKVDLEVENACGDKDFESKIVKIDCIPKVSAGTNHCIVDFNDLLVGIPIGDPLFSNETGVSYRWEPSTYLTSPNNPQTTFKIPIGGIVPPFPYKLKLIATSSIGCERSEDIYLLTQPQFDIVEKKEDCCGVILEVVSQGTGNETFQYLWNTGETTQKIEVKTIGTYSVKVSNGCSDKTKSYTINSLDTERYYRTRDEIEASEMYIAQPDNQNGKNAFYISHYEPTAPNYGRYSATHYRLTIFDRWGTRIRIIEDSITTCNGFVDGAIQWDGTVNGNNVQGSGTVYNGTLEIKNCRYKEYKEIRVKYCAEAENVCEDLRCEFYLGYFGCGFFMDYSCYSIGTRCTKEKQALVFPIKIYH